MNQKKNLIQFGVFLQAVDLSTIWQWKESGSQIEFDSFRRVAQTAERGVFAAFFLGEGLRVREQMGRIYQYDIAGRPDSLSVQSALAAVTDHIGLVSTLSATYNDPVDLAYRLANLNLLSEGRNGWNIVTTNDEWVGKNFRRGGYVSRRDRYTHAAAFVEAVRQIWAIANEKNHTNAGDFYITRETKSDAFSRVYNEFYDLAVNKFHPLFKGGEPVFFQSGDSSEGRDFGAKYADIVFTSHSLFEPAVKFALDLNRRAIRFGRKGKVQAFPGTFFVIADSKKEAEEKLRYIQESQVTEQKALSFLEHIWGRDLSDYDPDGPLPEIDPIPTKAVGSGGIIFQNQNTIETKDNSTKIVEYWRRIAQDNNWSIREFVINNLSQGLVFYPDPFVGTVNSIADELEKYAHTGIVAGFNITPYLIPSGLDEIVDKLIPELQNRKIYPDKYLGTNLRENLQLDSYQHKIS